jgi:hypothetical protein
MKLLNYVNDQSTGFLLIVSRYSFAFEKHLQPKNLVAEKGEGCADFIILCFLESMSRSFLCANAPHNIKTQPLFLLDIILMTLSVNISQPNVECEPGLCALFQKSNLKFNL